MKRFIKSTVLGLMVLAAPATLLAADWTPPGPIKLLIGFAAGGGADTQARLIAEALEAEHGWSIVPEQLTGKGGTLLAAELADAPADGTTIGMIVTETLGYNAVASGNDKLALENFTPVVTTAGFQMGLVALSNSDFTTYDKIKEAAAAGTPIRFGVMSPRLGDVAYHLGQKTGVDFNIVSLKGGKAVMNALNAGDIDIGWGAGIQTKAVIAGDMVNVASGISKPLDASPDAPLITDLGSEFANDGYFLFAAPAGLPAEAREALASAIQAVVDNPETKAGGLIKKAFGGSSVIVGDELDALLASDVENASKLMKAVQ